MKTVMIIEDDLYIRETLQEILEHEGFSTFVAENGAVALSLLDAGVKPTVILLDFYMPIKDGADFLKELKQQVPVILMTAAFVKDLPVDFEQSRIVTKPINMDDLLHKLSQF